MANKSSFKKVLLFGLAGLGVVFIACVAFIAYILLKVDNKYTGEELFAAVNSYRSQVGAPALQLDLALCDNLVERWLSVRQPNSGHKGFEEWLVSEGLAKDGQMVPPFVLVGELYVNATTPDNAIAWWSGSPGHRLTLEKPDFNVGCAYASEGTGVVMMGVKQL